MGWPGPMTYRQFQVFRAWDQMQWNRPNRTDYYLMRLIQVLIQVNSPKRKNTKLEDQKIEFQTSRQNKEQQSAEDATTIAIALWAARFGGAHRIRGLPKKYGGTAEDPEETPTVDRPE